MLGLSAGVANIAEQNRILYKATQLMVITQRLQEKEINHEKRKVSIYKNVEM